jgi:mannose-6-phosphate isomerase-like protein (cupin superfamily)
MKILVCLLGILYGVNLSAQRQISDWAVASDENITVERLAGDSLTTSFLIQITDEVPLHYHAVHSEHVYILSGRGKFVLNSDTTSVSEGMYMFIPAQSHHSVKVTSEDPMRVLSIQCPEFTGKDRIKVP